LLHAATHITESFVEWVWRTRPYLLPAVAITTTRRPTIVVVEACIASRGSWPHARTSIRMRELLPHPCAPTQCGRRAVSSPVLAMRRHLVRDSLDRRLLRSHGRPGKGFHHFPRTFGIGDPFGVELVRTGRDATVAF